MNRTFPRSGKKRSQSAHGTMELPWNFEDRWSGTILALDLGTSMGYSIWNADDGTLLDYEQRLTYKRTRKSEPKDRWLTFLATLTLACNKAHGYAARTEPGLVPLVVYEQWVMPLKASGAQAITIFGGMKALTELHSPMYCGVSVGTWKRLSVGKGSATKQEYVNRASEIASRQFDLDDEDVCAAICIGDAACKALDFYRKGER